MSVNFVNSIPLGELTAQRKEFSHEIGTVQIWSIDLDAKDSIRDACLNALSEKEQKNISFFKFKRVQENYIISQGGLKLLLSNYLNIPTSEVKLGKHKKGKPYSVDNPQLHFNMSNSGKKVVYAFSMDEELGIDLEQLRALHDLNELIQKNYTKKEQEYINKRADQVSFRFFKFWTIKEAYLKAIGVGMRIPPEHLEFTVQNGNYQLQSIQGVPVDLDQDAWNFKHFTLENESYVGTLAIKNPDASISLRSVL